MTKWVCAISQDGCETCLTTAEGWAKQPHLQFCTEGKPMKVELTFEAPTYEAAHEEYEAWLKRFG